MSYSQQQYVYIMPANLSLRHYYTQATLHWLFTRILGACDKRDAKVKQDNVACISVCVMVLMLPVYTSRARLTSVLAAAPMMMSRNALSFTTPNDTVFRLLCQRALLLANLHPYAYFVFCVAYLIVLCTLVD